MFKRLNGNKYHCHCNIGEHVIHRSTLHLVIQISLSFYLNIIYMFIMKVML